MVLDTSVCVDLLRETRKGEEGPARSAIRRLGDTPLFLSYFTLCELHTGVELSSAPDRERKAVQALVSRLTVLHPDESLPVMYGEAAAELLRTGVPIPVMDLLIGITAKSRGLPILTRDRDHFARIPGLTVESY